MYGREKMYLTPRSKTKRKWTESQLEARKKRLGFKEEDDVPQPKPRRKWTESQIEARKRRLKKKVEGDQVD